MLPLLVLLSAAPPPNDYPCPAKMFLTSKSEPGHTAMQVIDCSPVFPEPEKGQEITCTQTLTRVTLPSKAPVPSVDEAKAKMRAGGVGPDGGTELELWAKAAHNDALEASQTCLIQVGLPAKLQFKRAGAARRWTSESVSAGGLFCRVHQFIVLEAIGKPDSNLNWKMTFTGQTLAADKQGGCKVAPDYTEVYEADLTHKFRVPTEGCSFLKLEL